MKYENKNKILIKYKNKIEFPIIPFLPKVYFSALKRRIVSLSFANPLNDTFILQPPKMNSSFSTLL